MLGDAMQSIRNRFGHTLKIGQKVSFALARGGRETGTIKAIDAKSEFAKTYGAQVSFSDSPFSCTIDDCLPAGPDKTIAQLKAEGYEGMDVSLNISLHEQGLAWKCDGADFRFIYSHPILERRFDWGCIRADVDPAREWNWVKWEDIASYTGQTAAEVLATPLPLLVSTLLSYHGAENIFGTSYHEGFTIEDTDEA